MHIQIASFPCCVSETSYLTGPARRNSTYPATSKASRYARSSSRVGRRLYPPGSANSSQVATPPFRRFLAPSATTTAALQELGRVLRDRYHVAPRVDYEPRYLHATGQLHKGGPNTGVFLQLTDEPADDIPIPETNYDFGEDAGG